MSTAEELLCSRKWRLTHSLWMLWGWFPFALTAWIGYLIIGIKAKNWKWIVTAVALFIFGSVWIGVMGWIGGETNIEKGDSFPEPYATFSNIAMWSSTLVWLGNAVALQWWINRKWLVWRAHNDKSISVPWYATVTAGGPLNAQADPHRVATVIDNAFANGSASSGPVAAQPSPTAAPSFPPSGAPFTRDAGQAPAALDINTATQSELAGLPGFNAATAAELVAARDQAGGFLDPADLVTRGGVKPHILAGLHGWITVIPTVGSDARAQAPAPAPIPRAMPTSDNGRRLEF